MKSMSIRAKLMLLLGFLLGAMLLNSLGSEVAVRQLIGLNQQLEDQGLVLVDRTADLRQVLYKTRGDLYKMLAMRDEIETIGADLDKELVNIDSAINALEAIRPTVSDSAAIAIERVVKVSGAYKQAIQEVLTKARKGDFEFGTASMKTGTAHLARKDIDMAVEALIAQENRDVRSIEETTHSVNRAATRGMMVVAIALLVIGLGGGYYIIRSIIEPIHRLSGTIDLLGDGDFRKSESRIEAEAAEIARMAGSIERMRNSLREAFGSVSKTAMSAMESSESQNDMTRTLSSEAEANEREAQSSAAAAQEASATIKGVLDSAGSSMARLESISAAIEEMTASIAEIARSAERTNARTNSALDGARHAAERMGELASASKEIENMVQMIIDISEQTKLLALNATIEAARAGESGKGFAVVAGEVKELAKNTSVATEDIRRRVETMRSSTENAVAEIAKVSESMTALGEDFTSIAGAVEQQSATTREIARSVGSAVHENREIQRSMDAGAIAVDMIAKDISGVLERGRTLRTIAVTAKGISEQTAEQAALLSEDVARFRL